jgi:hypothetical protein
MKGIDIEHTIGLTNAFFIKAIAIGWCLHFDLEPQ